MTKTILVTGGNRGIGLEICRQLAEIGHEVIMGTRDLEKGKLAVAKMALPVDLQAIDVTNTNHIEKLGLYLSEAYGGLDVLINNASIKVNAMCPGWVKTEMGGAGATRTVEQGADTAVWLSTEENISSGLFFRDRKVISG